jgi:poly(beta-D-mannuronate) lyase
MPVRPTRTFPPASQSIKLVLLLASGLAVGTCVRAATVTVSTVAQLNASLATNQPGDTILLTNKIWQDADILFKKNGTAANPITLRAQTPGQVILSGSSRLRISGRWLVVDGLRFQNGYITNSDVIQFRENSSALATNCALINSTIVDYSAPLPPDESTDYKWVSIYGLSNRVENCYLKGKTNMGTTLVVWLAGSTNDSNHHVIRRNYFGLRPNLGVNGGETIRIGTGDVSFINSRTLVEENYFQFCGGEVEMISNKSGENVYRYNTFDSCAGTLTLRQGKRCTVEGNWFFGHGLPQTGGVRIIDEDHRVVNNYFDGLTGSDARSALCMMNGTSNSPPTAYVQVKRAQVLFNTFVNCSHNFLIGRSDGGGALGPIDCTNANNIVRGSSSPLIEIQTAPTNFLWEGNFFSGATVGLTNAGIATNDPLLVLSSDGFWRPATNSPVLGAAAGTYAAVTNDFDGQPRPAAKDSGCDQSSTNAMVRRPLGPTDVGPVWMRSVGPIRTVDFVSNSLALTWDSLPALTYQVQFSSNLLDWASVSQTVSNLQTTASWADDGTQTGGAPATQTQRFYRIRLLP